MVVDIEVKADNEDTNNGIFNVLIERIPLGSTIITSFCFT